MTGLLRSLIRLLVLSFCIACGSNAPLAVLQQKQGAVERDFAAQPRTWKPGEPGATFGLGDGIQTLSEATALLALDDGARLAMESDTLIRFSATPPQPHVANFDVEVGSAALHAGGGPLSLQTAAGLALLQAGTHIELSRVPEGLRLMVEVGQAVFGELEPLGALQGVVIDAAGKLRAIEPTQAPADEASPTAEPSEATGDVMAQVTGRRASIQTPAGWTALAEGSTRLSPGTELKLSRNTSVRLERGNERAVLNQNGRYVIAPRPNVLVAASAGSLSVAGSGLVRIALPGGVLVVAAEGRASIQLEEKNARIEVLAREALVESARGNEKLSAGERAILFADGEVSVEGRSLDYADLELSPGQSMVIHDPKPPTAVRFLFGSACAETATLQLFSGGRARQYAAGREAVALGMKPGSYRYELRCAPDNAKVAKSGSVTVLKDAGTSGLARHPPTSTLQADGRNYTVLYQNRLPGIELSWPSPPSSKQLRLIHQSAGAKQTLDLTEPAYKFTSGSLSEGKHVFSFVGGGKVSRQTTVSILFDNAAPKASLNTPVTLSAKPGTPVAVSGTALPGWDVMVEGRPAQRDPQGRFSLDATLPTELRALAIQLSHPERETHVYLRRGQP